jgi:undecaprenyl pyrophosphate synthase
VAAFLLLSLGLMLGMFIEKSLKKLSFRKPESNTASLGYSFDLEGNGSHLLPPVDKKLVPKHIAVIMDGNRRFGKLTHADPLQGHWAGGQTLIDFVQWCMLDGVEMATVYAFSTENWNRDPLEVTTLMTIFAKYAESFLTEALSNGVKVQIFSTGEIFFFFLFLLREYNYFIFLFTFSADIEKLPPKVRMSIQDLQTKTTHCSKFTLNLCLSYGGRRDLVIACQRIAQEVSENKITVGEINEETVSRLLQTGGIPGNFIFLIFICFSCSFHFCVSLFLFLFSHYLYPQIRIF